MKKKIICLLLVAVAIALLIFLAHSCVVSDEKYGYEDMSEYIKLPKYKNYVFTIEEDAIKQAIGTYLMQYSSEYTVKRGDRINVDIKFYDLVSPDVSLKGEEIKELFQDNIWIEKVATPTDSNYQISYQIENGLIGSKIGATINKEYTLASDFFVEEYRGKKVFVDVTVNNTECQLGDVLLASYTGYYVDDDGNIIKEDGKDKTFDSSEKSSFYIGSNLAIKEFEEGLIGMTIGVEKDIYATFPEEYEPEPSLAGKKVMFRTKVTALYTPPIYNDAFVTTYFNTFKNVQEFEDALRKEYLLSLVYDYISDNAQVIEYPEYEYTEAENQLTEIEGTWADQYGMTLDAYIKATYGMTRDAYIKSNMKTEMIFYALRNEIGDSVEPTDEELEDEKDSLIAYYKSYYMQNNGLSESEALSEAKEFVETLGDSYVYEQVLYSKIDNKMPTLVKTKNVASEKDYVFDAKTE